MVIWEAIKTYNQKFYRINGGLNPIEGVKMMWVVPDRYSYIELGEKGSGKSFELGIRFSPSRTLLFGTFILIMKLPLQQY